MESEACLSLLPYAAWYDTLTLPYVNAVAFVLGLVFWSSVAMLILSVINFKLHNMKHMKRGVRRIINVNRDGVRYSLLCIILTTLIPITAFVLFHFPDLSAALDMFVRMLAFKPIMKTGLADALLSTC